tara:strand:+ start:1788 stop:2684 length:897 start_codon:yes stop_codon:yes gene_type:complete
MKKITIYLSGGLGNQMFQYAFGRALALRHSRELVIDDWSGFIRDFQYKRKYELKHFDIKARSCNLIEKLSILIYKIECFLFKNLKYKLFVRRIYGEFRNDLNLKYDESLLQKLKGKNIWYLGYFQSPKYFDFINKELLEEFTISKPKQIKFLNMAKTIVKTESVAIGVRLYEESEHPNSHCKDGKIKTVDDINQTIDKIKSKLKNPKFFVFCTFRSPILEKLNLPKDSIFLTHEDGFEGTFESLWLLSKCKHHIFTNSSYYWWGAWLSQLNYKSREQFIFGANNFYNKDTLLKNWHAF